MQLCSHVYKLAKLSPTHRRSGYRNWLLAMATTLYICRCLGICLVHQICYSFQYIINSATHWFAVRIWINRLSGSSTALHKGTQLCWIAKLAHNFTVSYTEGLTYMNTMSYFE